MKNHNLAAIENYLTYLENIVLSELSQMGYPCNFNELKVVMSHTPEVSPKIKESAKTCKLSTISLEYFEAQERKFNEIKQNFPNVANKNEQAFKLFKLYDEIRIHKKNLPSYETHDFVDYSFFTRSIKIGTYIAEAGFSGLDIEAIEKHAKVLEGQEKSRKVRSSNLEKRDQIIVKHAHLLLAQNLSINEAAKRLSKSSELHEELFDNGYLKNENEMLSKSTIYKVLQKYCNN